MHFRQRISKGNTDREVTWKNLAKVILFLAFALGILLANFMGKEKTAGVGILNDYFIEKFKYAGINRENLFFYIIGERLPEVLLLLLLAFSSLGIVVGLLNLGWQGFSIGFMVSAAIAKYGAGGFLIILGSLFPQYIFYMAVYAGCCGLTVFLRGRFQNIVKTGGINREQMRVLGMGTVAGLFLLLVFVTGIFLESYINPIFLKKILKFF